MGQLLNLLGLMINFVGALLMYMATPKIDSAFGFQSDPHGDRKNDAKRNQQFRLGMGLIVSGFIIQLISAILDFSKHNKPH